jgi:hypothetical protein
MQSILRFFARSGLFFSVLVGVNLPALTTISIAGLIFLSRVGCLRRPRVASGRDRSNQRVGSDDVMRSARGKPLALIVRRDECPPYFK